MPTFANPRLALVLGTLASFGLTSAAHAVAVSESFVTGTGGYVADANLSGQGTLITNGSTGWSGNWSSSAFYEPVTAGLTSSSDGTLGGSVMYDPSADGDQKSGIRSLSSTVAAGAAPVTFWASALVQANDSVVPATNRFMVEVGGTAPSGVGSLITNGVMGFGVVNGVAVIQPGTSNGATITNLTDTGAAGGTTVAGIGSTLFFVLKIERNPADLGGTLDRVSAWVNPTDVSSESALTTSSSGRFTLADTDFYSNALAVTTMGFDVKNISDNSFLDELRLADSLAQVVVPVPEPASLGLLAVAGGLLLRRPRRQPA